MGDPRSGGMKKRFKWGHARVLLMDGEVRNVAGGESLKTATAHPALVPIRITEQLSNEHCLVLSVGMPNQPCQTHQSY